jgi:hypothetical protein
MGNCSSKQRSTKSNCPYIKGDRIPPSSLTAEPIVGLGCEICVSLSDSVTSDCPISLRALNAVAQRSNVASLTPSSLPTVATGMATNSP